MSQMQTTSSPSVMTSQHPSCSTLRIAGEHFQDIILYGVSFLKKQLCVTCLFLKYLYL